MTEKRKKEADDTEVTGWEDNTAEFPEWTGNPLWDDFRLDGPDLVTVWFPAEMRFTSAQSKAWVPD